MDHLDALIGSLSRRLLLAVISILSASLGAVTLDVSESPRSNLVLSLRAILSAQKSIVMNAYELTSYDVADALIQKINEGVRVELLQEGQPVGGLVPEAKDIQKKIAKAMEANSSSQLHGYWVMTSETPKGKRRFRYNHAKYIVIDEKGVMVGSENYSPSGQPEPGSTGGTRGWQTFIYDEQMSRNFLKVFRKDINTSHGDLVTLYSPKIPLPKILGRVADWVESMQNVATRIENRFSWMLSDEPKTLDADNVEFLTSPESSMVGLMAFIESAQETLDVELMSFNPMWGKTGEVSPLFNAIVAAAKRGVKIRVLVNDSTVFGGDNDPEMKLLAMLENVAKENHLPIQAAIADLPKMKVKYIHNKGALADGYKTLISSINWNQNSVENNRETAISVDSRSINEHYQSIFNWDWQASH
jgi:phosphatidylserine/phosphatidylglycerophosphate/cardiolipin synthase-like enzyme